MARTGCPKGSKKLSFRHRIVVNAFLSDPEGNKAKAMLEGGYSPSTHADAVFNRPDVAHEIERLQQKVLDKYEVTREWVMEQLVAIATAGATLAKFKVVDDDGKLDWDFRGATEAELALIDTLAVTVTETKQGNKIKNMRVGVPSRQTALDALCRVNGFNRDKLELDGELNLVQRIQRGRDRANPKERKDEEVL